MSSWIQFLQQMSLSYYVIVCWIISIKISKFVVNFSEYTEFKVGQNNGPDPSLSHRSELNQHRLLLHGTFDFPQNLVNPCIELLSRFLFHPICIKRYTSRLTLGLYFTPLFLPRPFENTKILAVPSSTFGSTVERVETD